MVSNNYMQKGNGLRIAVGITMLALMLAGGAGASTLTVNASSEADYTKIQNAIDNASDGNTTFQNGNISEKALDANIKMLERVQAQPFKSNVSSRSRFDINSLKSEHKAGELLVKYNRKSPKKDIENFYKLQKMTLIKDYPGIGYHLIRVEESRLENTMEVLSQSDKFENGEPNYIVKADRNPNDSSFNQLWGLYNTGQTGGTADADIDAPEAWNISNGSNKVIVAVIDTGVDYTHEDLAANMWTNRNETPGNGIDDDNNGFIDDYYGWDFAYDDNDPMDVYGHGTHVSGTIGGVGNNGKGVAGVSWNVSIMAVKFLSDSGHGTTSDAIDAINYARMMGVDIMSNSWGGGGYSSALEAAIQAANDSGILFVASAGNAATNTDQYPQYPSSYGVPNVMSIAATDSDDYLAYFSNYGALSVDIGAPGVGILSSVIGNGYSSFSGTSMAVPHVSGAAALLKAFNPTLTHLEIKEILMNSVDPIPSLNGITVTGGRLNIHKAMIASPSISFINPTPANGATVNQNYAFINTTVSNVSTAFIDWNLSLAGWWRFSGETLSFFRDSSSWGNDGTCSGVNCPSFTSGKFGNALNFDGINDYVDAGNGASLDITDAITIEAWINPAVAQEKCWDGVSGNYGVMSKVSAPANSVNWSWALRYGADGGGCYLGFQFNGNPEGPRWVTGKQNLAAGHWYHVAGTFNGTEINSYLNGNLMDTNKISAIKGYRNRLLIGNDGWANLFNGKIDEVRIHKRALSPEEIKASYDAGINRLYRNFTGLAIGSYNYQAYAQNLAGPVNKTETRTLTFASNLIASPSISFINPTPANGATVNQNYANINTTVSDSSTAFIDWNSSLIGWWRLNNESSENPLLFRDSSGWGNNGTCSGVNCPSFTSGKFGNALNFDGINDYVDAGNGASLNIIDAITIETWINPSLGQEKCWDGVSGNYGVMSKVSAPANSVNWSWQLKYGAPDGGCYLGFQFNGNPEGPRWVTVKQNLAAGHWYHVAGTFNGTEINSYLNGNLMDTNKISAIKGYRNRLLIGNDGWANLFNGKIDEVRIHKRALSPEEIKASYDAGINRLYRNFTGLAIGSYNYQAYAQNLAGAVNKTETRSLTIVSNQGLPEIRFINGTVKDNSTGNSLAGVNVSANSTLSTISNATGFYSFAVIDGTYNLTATFDIRYYTKITTVSTIGKAVAVQDIKLVRKPTGTITGNVKKCCNLG